MQITGREFSEATLDRIRARIQGDPTLTRTALSREVCEWLGWQGHEGRPQDMSCRVALLTLARRGLIELPPAQPVSFARAADAREPAFVGLTLPRSSLKKRPTLHYDQVDWDPTITYKGKARFPGGTQIPPTTVNIIRPKGNGTYLGRSDMSARG